MNMESWAAEEIRRAIAQEAEGSDGEDDPRYQYAVECYMNAADVLGLVLSQEHSGMSMKMTMNIVNRLVDGIPLTPLTGEDDEWNEVTWDNSGTRVYQNKRKSSLFKHVLSDGSVQYTDNDAISGFNPGSSALFHNGFVSKIVSSYYPSIQFPYVTPPRIHVCVEDFQSKQGDSKHSDFDTMGILYAVQAGERTEINRYFKEEGDSWKEISKEEYESRR